MAASGFFYSCMSCYLTIVEVLVYGTILQCILLVGNNFLVVSCMWGGSCVKITSKYN